MHIAKATIIVLFYGIKGQYLTQHVGNLRSFTRGRNLYTERAHEQNSYTANTNCHFLRIHQASGHQRPGEVYGI